MRGVGAGDLLVYRYPQNFGGSFFGAWRQMEVFCLVLVVFMSVCLSIQSVCLSSPNPNPK